MTTPRTYTYAQTVQESGAYVDREFTVTGPLYHGGGRRLRSGDDIRPGRTGQRGDYAGQRSPVVYFTTRLDTAAAYADASGGHVFEVEPAGAFTMDRSGDDFKTAAPLRVLRRLDRSEWS
jgi:hypothetical protein